MVFALIALEIGLRLFEGRPYVDHEHVLPGSPFGPHPDFIMIPRRMVQSDFLEGERLRAKGRSVVMCLGDSFTQGYPVDPSHSYPAVLEELLPQCCVVNLGIGDSGPDRQLAYFQRWVLPRLKPQLVIWALYANDVRDNVRTAVQDIDPKGQLVFTGAADHWLLQRDRLCRSSRPLRGFLRHTYLGRHGLQAMRRAPQPQRSDYRNQLQEWSRQKVRLELAEMQRLSRLHGFSLLIVRVAPQEHYPDHRSIKYQELTAIVDRPDVEILFESAEGLFCNDGRDSNPPGSRHFNEAGYRRMAEEIAPQVRLRLKPGSRRAREKK